jgi:glycosyltransferase involved in cell wall biosynthesis
LVASPPVSVVICTRDRPHLLADALMGLRVALREGDEALVVDSASRTGETARVGTGLGFEVVRVGQPGLARARNAGVRATTHELIAFTDDDCVPAPTWLDGIVAGFTDERTGIVMGRVVAEHPGGAVPADDPGDAPFAFGATADVSVLGAGAVAAKVAKVDPRVGRRALVRRAWHDGARQAARDLRRRYERAAIGDALYGVGVVVGAAAVWRRPVLQGLLSSHPAALDTPDEPPR